MMAHALGNPFDLRAVTEFCKKHGTLVIEDNCDSLGSTYTFPMGRRALPEPLAIFPPSLFIPRIT